MSLSSSALFLDNMFSERLLIRPLIKRDLQQYQEIFTNPQTTEFTGGLLTAEEVKSNFNRCLEALEVKAVHYLTLAILAKSNGVMIGITTLIWQEGINNRFELGVMFNHKNQRKGYCIELVNRLLEQGFNTCSLDSVFSFTLTKNIPAQLVLKKLGFTKHLNEPPANYNTQGIYWAISKKDFERQ